MRAIKLGLGYNLAIMNKQNEFHLTKKLDHIAFIMDGNGRWATLRGLPRHLGHHEACKRIREIFDACLEFGICNISVYAFSTENWNRPQDEIDHLMDYLEEFLARELDYVDSVGGKIIVSGELGRIREKTRKACLQAIERTSKNTKSILNVCLNYGSRDEIARACRMIAEEVKEGKRDIESITPETISDHLYTAQMQIGRASCRERV